MEPIDILKGARELLSDPARWTQGAMARNALGQELSGARGHREGVCFCTLGALEKVGMNPDEDGNVSTRELIQMRLAKRLLYPHLPKYRSHVTLAQFNDHGTHEGVLALFDRAIAANEQK